MGNMGKIWVFRSEAIARKYKQKTGLKMAFLRFAYGKLFSLDLNRKSASTGT